jgi:LCP family protein required for cell wall assembly
MPWLAYLPAMAQRRRRAGLRGRRDGTQWGPSAPLNDPTPGSPTGPVRALPRRRVWPWVVLALLLVIAVPVGYFGYSVVSTLFTISPGANPGPIGGVGGPQAEAPPGTTYVLVMGSDERRDRDGKPIPGEAPHSDTMILFALDSDKKQARMLSVPRDLLVTIPGYGPDHRINEAYTLGENNHLAGGGPALAVKTMEQLTGLHIPYYAVTTFDGFRQTVDALGGVYVDVDRPLTDHDYPGQGNDFMPIYIPAGRQVFNGERALEYVRSRHDDPLSDFGRNQRQQKFVNAVSKKMLQPERLTQFNQFMDIVKANVRTNLSPAQILGLGNAMVSVGKGHVQGYAVGPGYVHDPSGSQRASLGAVLVPDKAAVTRLVKAFVDGTPAPDVGNPTPAAQS